MRGSVMAERSVVGLFTDENVAADAMDALKAEGYETNEYEVLTGTPYPEGTFGEHEPEHKAKKEDCPSHSCFLP